MEPRIQYAKTKDGVNIAYWTMGSGLPLVEMPSTPWSHVQLELQVPLWRAWDERLAENRMHVRYDHRGTGMSDRNVAEVSLETLVLDLEAIVDRLALEKFVLFGHHITSAAAITYAVRYPERVSQLILWCCYPRTGVGRGAQTKALSALLKEDWETYTETLAHTVFGWSEGKEAHRFAGVMRECSTSEIARAYFDAEFDVADVLASVKCPTLVVQRRGYQVVPVEWAKEVCSRIPNAQLALLEGTTGVTYMENMEALAVAIDEFLGDAKPRHVAAEGDTAIILFLDIADSTALTTKLGDAAYRERERELDGKLRSAISDASGTPVEGKVLGDGVMAVFTSARQAIDAAQRCRELGNEAGLPLHLGIHAGDVVREGNNVHGGAVQLAARVQSAAAPGEILVSATVRDLARTSAGVAFEDRGEHELKGIAEPQRLFAVRERG